MGFTSPDTRLKYDFDVAALLEIKIRPSADWTTVDPNVFRSWTGARRIDGKPYTGTVYYWLSNTCAT